MVEITLIARGTRGSHTLRGEYKDKRGDMHYLVDDGRKAVSRLADGEKVFTRMVPAENPLKFSLDETNQTKFKGVLDFFKNHPSIKCDGHDNPNLAEETFTLLIPWERANNDYLTTVTKLAVAATIFGMTPDERVDTVFALGGDARGKDDQSVFNYLIGTSLNGLATANANAFLEYRKLGKVTSEAILYANKAVRYGIVNKENNVYKVNERILGTSISQVADALRVDIQLFDGFIKPEVDALDANEKSKIVRHEITNDNLPDEIKNEIPALVAKDIKKSQKA